MAKKKRNISDRPSGKGSSGEMSGGAAAMGMPAAMPAADAAPPAGRVRRAAAALNLSLPAEVTRGDWTVIILATMMVLAPGLGVPHEEMLQDTLKSIVVSFCALIAAVAFFWQQRNRRDALRWHGLVWLPAALCVYALGSMAWSHTYLAGVEAIRWFIFTLIVWLGLNTISRERLPQLAWGLHWGAVVASLWALLQFWVDFKYFPQGPNPASTFVNRNFYAEYVVCTFPFTALLLARSRTSASIALLAFTWGFNIIGLLSTGTRSALAAMWMLVVLLPFIAWRYRKQFAFPTWDSGKRIVAIGVLLSTVIGLGLINSDNAKILGETRGNNALQRGLSRSASVVTDNAEYTSGSFSVRLVMWKATGRIIERRPLTGVGAGAWEADIPLYQAEGSQLETDYYVHNEILQLLAEYGLVGWLFLLSLVSYLLWAAWRTLRDKSADMQSEAPFRAITLSCLAAFLLVSNAGFPWRMASTGAMFALCLAILAASDARLALRKGPVLASRLAWKPAYSQMLAVGAMMCTALAAYITQQAAECESKIVKATKIAMTISASGDYNNPKWDKPKAEMLKLIKEGTDINPHYRKITPMVADELAKWGDWKDAVWVWESVVSSRHYVVAIMSNIARGYASMGQPEKALEFLARAKKIQPKAPSVRSLEVILLSRTGKEAEGLKLAREAIADGVYDFDLVNACFILGWRAADYPFAQKCMDLRFNGWPATKAGGFMQLGNMYLTGVHDQAKSFEAFRQGVELTPPPERAALRPQIPQAFWPKLGLAAPATTATAVVSQTSASSK